MGININYIFRMLQAKLYTSTVSYNCIARPPRLCNDGLQLILALSNCPVQVQYVSYVLIIWTLGSFEAWIFCSHVRTWIFDYLWLLRWIFTIWDLLYGIFVETVQDYYVENYVWYVCNGLFITLLCHVINSQKKGAHTSQSQPQEGSSDQQLEAKKKEASSRHSVFLRI